MAKKAHGNDRCMAAGICLGRLVCGLAALDRALAEPDPWSAAYAVSTTARPMVRAFRSLERSLGGHNAKLRAFSQMLEPLVDSSGSGFNRQKVQVVKDQVYAGLVDLGKSALENCGKSRQSDDAAGALLRTRRAPRKAAP